VTERLTGSGFGGKNNTRTSRLAEFVMEKDMGNWTKSLTAYQTESQMESLTFFSILIVFHKGFNGIPNGIINGTSNGNSNGIPNGTPNGIPNKIPNGIPN
jgi:hypothetical protein